MDMISSLPDELLVKILLSVPTKDAVSTSILSKRWERLWMWVPKLECDCSEPGLEDFIVKNLPLRAPLIESLCLEFTYESFHLKDFKLWLGIAVSHCLRELDINYYSDTCFRDGPDVLFPRSLYACTSLVTLKLKGAILVDVPSKVYLPCLKNLEFEGVTYSNQDSLQLLLSHCPVLDDLIIERVHDDDNLTGMVVTVPSLQRLSLQMNDIKESDGYVIATPCLKYFRLDDGRDTFPSLIEHMPMLEEADFSVTDKIEKFLEPITNVKRLSVRNLTNSVDGPEYRAGIAFSRLEHLKLCICSDYWAQLVVYFLKSSPNLRVLYLYVDLSCFIDDFRLKHCIYAVILTLFLLFKCYSCYEEYEGVNWKNERSSVPECLQRSLETF